MAQLFNHLGHIAYRFRYLWMGIWLMLFSLCLPFLPKIMQPFQSSGFENTHSQSQAVDALLNEKLGYHDHRFLVLFKTECDCCPYQEFRKEVLKSLKGFEHISYPHELIIQEQKNSILATLAFRDSIDLSAEDIEKLEQLIAKPKHAKVYFGGEDVFVESVNKQTQKDLFHADLIAAPFSIFTLLLVFGSVVAALLPVLIGGVCAVMMLTALYFIAHYIELSIFTINIALLLGLCLSLDYALFIISRFREELLANDHVSHAIARTMSTAGKAVFFSGLAVFCSLSALLLFPINILISVGVGGLCAVFLAVLGALTLLPAILVILKGRINAGAVFQSAYNKSYFWQNLAKKVIARPVFCVLVGLSLLLTFIAPVKHLKLGISDYHILPVHSEGRAFFNAYQDSFDESSLSPIALVIQTKGSIKSSKNIKVIYQLIEDLKKRKDVDKVSGYLSILPHGKLQQYRQLYQMPEQGLAPELRQLLKTSTHDNMAIFYVLSRYSSESEQTQQLVKDLRNLNVEGLDLYVTGVPVNNLEVFDGIKAYLPKAVYMILAVTFFILLILLRSLFLPFKAIVMNILSLSATYGILVYVFQEGHLHSYLNFEAQGSLDISMLVIIFCALFGFSMDYEVFLLTRIQEHYEKTGDNKDSIVYGVDHSARIITSAALIVIVLCASFLVAEVLMVKAFGLGIAVAIFIDAFIIRSFLVPAVMTLSSRINWYLPHFLSKILPKNLH